MTDSLARFSASGGVIEKNEMLVPRNINQQEQIALGGEIEKPAWRDVVDAEQVRAEFLDEREIGSGLFEGSEGLTISSGSERAVGDAFEKKLLGASSKEFSVHSDSRTIGKQISHASQTLGGTNLVTAI